MGHAHRPSTLPYYLRMIRSDGTQGVRLYKTPASMSLNNSASQVTFSMLVELCSSR
jgi:hypothetical protein